MEGVTRTEKNLVVAFIQFIRHKISGGAIPEDQAESLEVVIQCLEAAFTLEDADYAFQPSRPLIDTFCSAEGLSAEGSDSATKEATEAEKAEAEKLKNAGNELMKTEDYAGAVQKYTDAIKLHQNPVFFCNRAAAYGRLEQHDLAIQDCRTALALEPQYSKAFGRMGLALSCQKRYTEAVEAYKKAIELDPQNESFKNNLKVAEEKVEQEQRERAANTQQMPPNPFAGMGGFDIGSMLNNPAMMNMATQLMSDPNIQNMMGNLMSGAGGGQPGAPGGGGGGGGPGLGGLLQAGQQIAEQLQRQNPELIEQLRRQTQGGEGPDGSSSDGNNQNNPDSGTGGSGGGSGT